MSRVVDWPLAERIAFALAGEGPEWDGDEAELRAESERAGKLVRSYTGLRVRGSLPPAELIDREQWARTNLESFRGMSAEVEDAFSRRMEKKGSGSGFSQSLARAATGAEIGLAVGYLAQRVIGQYDVALLGPARAPRLLFVGPNLSAARGRLEVDRDLFLRWIALHETTHAVQFASVGWLREHLGQIASELLEKAAIEVKPGELLAKVARMNPRELVGSVARGELATLLWTEPQRQLVDQLLATMTLVEGYAEHVMDAVGDELDPRYAELRRRLDRDRERRGPLDKIVSRLLGLEMKMAQYKRGKAFADEVVELAGIKALNAAWSRPEALPTMDELDSPADWIERTSASRSHRLFTLFR